MAQLLPPSSKGELPRALTLWLVLALAAACLWPATTGPFVFDDFPNLANLAQLNDGVNSNSLGMYLYGFNGYPGRPLAALSFLIEDAAWPTDPEPFKRNNILWHLIAGVIVFALTRKLGRLSSLRGAAADWVALFCSACWLLQPIQLSATMLVVQRMNLLSSLFMLAGLYAYLRILTLNCYAEFSRVALAGIALTLFCMVAVLCKENGVLIFAYASAINFTLLGARLDLLKTSNRRLLILGCSAPVIIMALVALINIESIARGYSVREFSLIERLLTQPRILLDYLRMILLPRTGGQGIFHDDYYYSRSLTDPPTTWIAIVAVSAILASAIWLRRRYPVYSFAVLWFFAGHLIESTIIPLELYFEHRNYMPMVGPLFAFSYGLSKVWKKYRKTAIVAGSAWLALVTTLTVHSSMIWGDHGKLAAVWLAESPKSTRAVQMLASYYFDQGDLQAAQRVFSDGIERLPDHYELRYQRLLANCLTVGLSADEFAALKKAAHQSNNSQVIPLVIKNLVSESLGAGCKGTLTRDDVRELVAIMMKNPAFSNHGDTMGFLHYELAKIARDERDLDLLMYHMDKSHAYRPNPLVPREQAIYLLTAGLPDEALEYLDISEETPLPWFKVPLLNLRERNAGLRQSAISMKQASPSKESHSVETKIH